MAGPAVATAFGQIDRRATEAVAVDPYGANVSVSVEFILHSQLPATDSTLTRRETFDAERACVIHAVQFLHQDVTAEKDTISTSPGAMSSSEQLVTLARRLFDACPEADLLDVQVWQANQRPPTIDGVKTSRPFGHPTSGLSGDLDKHR